MKKLKITYLFTFLGLFVSNYSLKAQTPITQTNIQTAVNAWVAEPTAAEATYGHIKV